MIFDPKLSMSRAKKQVTDRGGPNVSDTLFLEDGVLTISEYQDRIAQCAQYNDWVSGDEASASLQTISSIRTPPEHTTLRLSSIEAEKKHASAPWG